MRLLLLIYLFSYLLLMMIFFGFNHAAGKKDYKRVHPTVGEPVKYKYVVTVKRELA